MCSAQSLSRSHPDQVRLLGLTGHLQGRVSSSRIDMKGVSEVCLKNPGSLLKDGVWGYLSKLRLHRSLLVRIKHI